jgi:hypothetical protein
MTQSKARQRELEQAIAATLSEEAGGSQRPQKQAGRGETETAGRARPLEFDRNGFPVAQRNSSFVTRVAQLLNPL